MVSVLPGIVFLEARMVTFNRKRQPIGSANTTLNPLTLAGATLLMILVTVIIMIKSSYSFQQFSMGCILETALTTHSTEAARHNFRQAPIILPHSKHHTLTELVTKQSESARQSVDQNMQKHSTRLSKDVSLLTRPRMKQISLEFFLT